MSGKLALNMMVSGLTESEKVKADRLGPTTRRTMASGRMTSGKEKAPARCPPDRDLKAISRTIKGMVRAQYIYLMEASTTAKPGNQIKR